MRLEDDSKVLRRHLDELGAEDVKETIAGVHEAAAPPVAAGLRILPEQSDVHVNPLAQEPGVHIVSSGVHRVLLCHHTIPQACCATTMHTEHASTPRGYVTHEQTLLIVLLAWVCHT